MAGAAAGTSNLYIKELAESKIFHDAYPMLLVSPAEGKAKRKCNVRKSIRERVNFKLERVTRVSLQENREEFKTFP